MVDYSGRMLAAIEEYSVKGSGHGQVALQSLRLRRSFATGLWGGKSGVLLQLKGVGATTIANLKFQGITTFQDVMNATSEVLDKSAQRTPPFGANLREVVDKILRSSLKLSAKLEYAQGSSTPCSITCDLLPRLDESIVTKAQSTSAVSYSILVYTDQPGGCLLFKTDTSGQSSFQVETPPEFGRITVALVASLVGLDGKCTCTVTRCQ